MRSREDIESSVDVSVARTRSYYRDLTSQYGRWAGRARGWHYGVWDPDVRGHVDALLRSNELLVQNLPLAAGDHVLDVGCGGGGFAVWAARRFGCKVTGVTLVELHAKQATRLAQEHGVAHLCEFGVAEMERLPFSSGTFDLVTNQESYCHARDKLSYLSEVRRVLRHGGHWRSVDFSVRPGLMDERSAGDYRTVLEGFQIPSLDPPGRVAEILEEVGYEQIRCSDISDRVKPSARRIRWMCRIPSLAMRLRVDWMLWGLERETRARRQGHFLAGDAYSRGLLDGHFQHGYYRARNAMG